MKMESVEEALDEEQERYEGDEDDDDEEEDDFTAELDLGDLDLTSEEFDFDNVDERIQENLEDEIVKEALNKGLDLRIYAKQIEEDLFAVERQSIEDYLSAAPTLVQLHNQIQTCDSILGTMEQMLGSFQADLGNISGEIQSLQEQSLTMNTKLKNRKAVQIELNDYVSKIIISPELVESICTGPINDTFMASLMELHEKLLYVASQPESIVSAGDVAVDLERLRIKGATRTREFMLQKIYAVRKPMSNPHMPQDTLLKYRNCFDFLVKHHTQLAAEVRDEYLDTMSKVHLTYFKTYISRLMKLQYTEVPDKDDMMGFEDHHQPKGGGFFRSKPSLKNRSTVFTIGSRGDILKDLESTVIVPHTIKKDDTTNFNYERLFRSIQHALMDNSAREYLFCVEFFGVSDSRGYELFKQVMGKTLALVRKHVEDYVRGSFDGIGLALCGSINQYHRKSLQEKNIPCLQPHFKDIDALLWPRFTRIIEMNAESIRLADPAAMSNLDTRPHYIIRRYAEYSGALLSLNEIHTNESVTKGLAVLMEEVGNFILRMAAEFPDRKPQLILLINNYDMMLSVYGEHTTTSSEEVSGFANLLKDRIRNFAEQELDDYYGGLLHFVKSNENMLKAAKNKEQVPVEQRKVQKLIQDFGSTWKSSLDKIDGDVLTSFTNFKNGTAILQAVLTQLVLYYERFLAILKQPPFKKFTWTDVIDRHHVLVEVKKHNKTF